jgi:hypothetical protein
MDAPTLQLGPPGNRLVGITLSHENAMDWHAQIQEQRLKLPDPEDSIEAQALLNLEYGLLEVANLVPPLARRLAEDQT